MSWSTNNELEFLKNLGMGVFATESTKVKNASRLELLKKYLHAAKIRKNWGTMDKGEIIQFVRGEIFILENYHEAA